MFDYDANAHGEYLGQYGTKKSPDGHNVPLVRVDKSKQALYSKLRLNEHDRKALQQGLKIISSASRDECRVANWRNKSYGSPHTGNYYLDVLGEKRCKQLRKQLDNPNLL